MVEKHAIKCPDCGAIVTYEEDIMYYVIPDEGIKCPECGRVVVESNRPTYLSRTDELK